MHSKNWLWLLVLVVSAWAAEPSAPPGPPAQAPPPVLSAAPKAPGPKVVTIGLAKGWTAFSLPLGRIASVEGLRYQLVRPTAAGPVMVDPSTPERIETGRAYWAYSEQPAQLKFTGSANRGDDPAVIVLETGWNFIGCPYERPLALTWTSVASRDGQAPIEVATDPGDAWVKQHALVWTQGRYSVLDLASPQATLTPAKAHWVYAYQPCMVNLNVGAAFPVIRSVSMEGSGVVLRGENLGTRSQGVFFMGDDRLPGTAITAWGPTEIRASGPKEPAQGVLTLLSDGHPSNRFAVKLPALPGAATTGSFSGRVLDDSGTPVSGARVLLQGASAEFTDARGQFSFANLSAGQHPFRVEQSSSRTLQGTVEVIAGRPKHLEMAMVTLRGSIQVAAYPCASGSKKLVPSEILIWETANWNHRTKKQFTDRTWAHYDLDFGDLVQGHEYTITVTWEDPAGWEQTITRKRTLAQSSLKESFWNSWSY